MKNPTSTMISKTSRIMTMMLAIMPESEKLHKTWKILTTNRWTEYWVAAAAVLHILMDFTSGGKLWSINQLNFWWNWGHIRCALMICCVQQINLKIIFMFSHNFNFLDSGHLGKVGFKSQSHREFVQRSESNQENFLFRWKVKILKFAFAFINNC